MKIFLSWLVVVLMLFSLTACDPSPDVPDDGSTTTASSATTTTTTTQPMVLITYSPAANATLQEPSSNGHQKSG